MQKLFGNIFLSTALFFSIGGVRADMLVENIHGSDNAIQVYKNDKQVTVIRLSVMTGGEVIDVVTDNAFISLIDDDGKSVIVNKINSPYTVEISKSKGWMDNAVMAALKWYNNFDQETSLAVSTVTKGLFTVPPITLLGMYGAENLVPNDLEELQFFWRGGKAPYQVQLLTEDGKVLMNKEVDAEHVAYSGVKLPVGSFTFIVENRGKVKKLIDKQTFQIVAARFLPETVNDHFEVSLPEPVKQSLVAIMLAKYPKWRFAALQYAVSSKDERLVKMLLENEFASVY
jgi:hypothetical protein